jgi:periplasmic divalent cation tolerance protein
MNSTLVLLCTCPEENVARTLAGGLVEERLAACVNVLPSVRSIYRWQGALQEDSETLMVIKTVASRYREAEDWLQRNHPYDVPEIIALPVEQGLPAYLEWVVQETKL